MQDIINLKNIYFFCLDLLMRMIYYRCHISRSLIFQNNLLNHFRDFPDNILYYLKQFFLGKNICWFP